MDVTIKRDIYIDSQLRLWSQSRNWCRHPDNTFKWAKKVDPAIKVAVLIYVQWTKAKHRAKMSKWKLQFKDKGNAATFAENSKKYRQATATRVVVMELLYIRRTSIFKCVNIDATMVAVLLYVEWN